MKNENILKLHQCLKGRRTVVTKNELIKTLDHCHERTLRRVIKELKDTHNAPIKYVRGQDGYCYTDENFELALPGLWLNTNTLFAIISAQHLLKHLNLDVLDKALSTLQHQIERFLKQRRLAPDQTQRIRILPINARITQPAQYQQIALALLTRTCLNITYHARGSDEITQRTVSPQRLAHYRDNWYLDA